jgi:hypothetical protein
MPPERAIYCSFAIRQKRVCPMTRLRPKADWRVNGEFAFAASETGSARDRSVPRQSIPAVGPEISSAG